MTRSFKNLVIYYKFVPSSATGGTWIGNLSATHTTGATAVAGGGGSYTIKGADTDKPQVLIVGQGQGSGHVTSPEGNRFNSSPSMSGLILEPDQPTKPMVEAVSINGDGFSYVKWAFNQRVKGGIAMVIN